MSHVSHVSHASYVSFARSLSPNINSNAPATNIKASINFKYALARVIIRSGPGRFSRSRLKGGSQNRSVDQTESKCIFESAFAGGAALHRSIQLANMSAAVFTTRLAIRKDISFCA